MNNSINVSDYGILNWDSSTRVPPNAETSSPLVSTSLITICSWKTLSTLSSDHLPILIRLQMKTTTTSDLRRTYVNRKKANWDRYRQEVEAALSKREKIFHTIGVVRRTIKSCRYSKAFGPDKLSIFHLRHLGPRSIEYITVLINLSVTTCKIPAIWKSSLIIPIPKPGMDISIGTSYRPISLLCQAAEVLESLILPTIIKYLQYIQPAPDKHSFRPNQILTRF